MIVVDIETSCNGQADYRFWRKGFRIDSIAASWRDESGAMRSWFSAEATAIDRFIRRLAETQKPLVVHNLGFEMGVFMRLYPELEFNWAADTMRLAQLLDNGGDWRDYAFKTADDLMDEILEGEETSVRSGLSLEAVASRFLPAERRDHKGPAHKWLEDNCGVRSKHGAHLHLLPPDLLREYNIADTDVTLLLYETLSEQHRLLGFDWSQDWVLYTNRCRLMQQAYIRGTAMDRDTLRTAIYAVDAEIQQITAEFFEATKEAREKWAEGTQSKKAKKDRKTADQFSVASNHQLKALFCEVLGLNIGRTTATGQKKVDAKELTMEKAAAQYPSFASKHLEMYGPLGKILYKRRKRLLVLQQMVGAYLQSEEDGRAHPEVRVSGTRTNRVAGGTSE